MQNDETTAFGILVPEAEAVLSAFRNRYVPSASEGMPAHITLLYPFKHPSAIDSALEDELRSLFLAHRKFSFRLASTSTFPEILYLEPTPSQPFSDLINAIVSRYPENPPYGGTFSDPVPHLTIVHSTDADEFQRATDEFIREFRDSLPIHASVDRVWLMEKRQAGWEERTTFELS